MNSEWKWRPRGEKTGKDCKDAGGEREGGGGRRRYFMVITVKRERRRAEALSMAMATADGKDEVKERRWKKKRNVNLLALEIHTQYSYGSLTLCRGPKSGSRSSVGLVLGLALSHDSIVSGHGKLETIATLHIT